MLKQLFYSVHRQLRWSNLSLNQSSNGYIFKSYMIWRINFHFYYFYFGSTFPLYYRYWYVVKMQKIFPVFVSFLNGYIFKWIYLETVSVWMGKTATNFHSFSDKHILVNYTMIWDANLLLYKSAYSYMGCYSKGCIFKLRNILNDIRCVPALWTV